MKKADELYIERLPGESIRAYMNRYRDKTGRSPTRETFIRGYQPIHKIHRGRKWSEHHQILAAQVGRDHYTWYGENFFFENEDDAFVFELCCKD